MAHEILYRQIKYMLEDLFEAQADYARKTWYTWMLSLFTAYLLHCVADILLCIFSNDIAYI